jgi:hypothetical protein
MSAASRTSSVVAAKIASSTDAPAFASSAIWSAYECPPPPIAPWKIVGFVVTPLTLRVEMSSVRLPDVMRSRDRSSSQMLTPCWTSCSVGVLMLPSPRAYFAAARSSAAVAARDSRAASTTASAVMPNFWNRVL